MSELMSLSNYGPLLLAVVSALLIVGGAYLTVRDMRLRRSMPTVRTTTPAGKAQSDATPATQNSPRSTAPTAPPSGPTRSRSERAAPPSNVADAASRGGGGGNAEVTIVRRTANAGTSNAGALQPDTAFSALLIAVESAVAEASAEKGDRAVEGQRWPSVENRWLQIAPLIEQAVRQINGAVTGVGLTVGPAGEAGWNFKNRGFGVYRRLEIGGRSVGWLRADINQELMLNFKARAHDPQHVLINVTKSQTLAGIDQAGALEALSVVVTPTARLAAWWASRSVDGDADTSGWLEVGPVAIDAFALAGHALKEVGARLIEAQKPAWEPSSGRYRWGLSVQVQQAAVAAISVDLVKHGLEIASHASERGRADLERKRRLDLNGLTAQSLAEAIAASAWPAVAHALERINPATDG